MAPRVTVLAAEPQVKRRQRSPTHNWYVKHRPWQIQPIFIAPVLPGETLKNLTLQARTVTDPIQNPLMGWWLEHYVFYVKLRDLYARDVITSALLKPDTDMSSIDGATDLQYYHLNGTQVAVNWPKLCLESIVDNYFRNEGEAAFDFVIPATTGLPVAGNMSDGWWNSLTTKAAITAAGVDQNLVSASAGQGDATTAVWTSEIDKAMREYEFARMNKVTDMTFEDWCEQFGIKMPEAELFRPELIRYSRDWTYPTNTIDPTSGVARSACSWSTQLRGDKDRFFKEPGFIVGVTCARPKVLMKNIRSNGVMLMRDAYSWLPASLANDPYSSLTLILNDTPITGLSADYYADIKDLFIHGDQFTNIDLSAAINTLAASVNTVALPTAALAHRYPASTDADALFITQTAGVSGLRQDGVVTLHILGRMVDTTPQNMGTNKTV